MQDERMPTNDLNAFQTVWVFYDPHEMTIDLSEMFRFIDKNKIIWRCINKNLFQIVAEKKPFVSFHL
jgi:hypothetical protein